MFDEVGYEWYSFGEFVLMSGLVQRSRFIDATCPGRSVYCLDMFSDVGFV